MPTPTPPTRTRRRQLGMTVVEVLVALIIITIGLLGMAGSTALALRTAHDAAQRRNTTNRAVTRQSQLAAAGCTNARSGQASDSTHAITEHWYVAVQPTGFALVTDSIQWMGARGPHSFVLESAFPC